MCRGGERLYNQENVCARKWNVCAIKKTCVQECAKEGNVCAIKKLVCKERAEEGFDASQYDKKQKEMKIA